MRRCCLDSPVYEGKDGWLFLTGGTNSIGALYDRDAALLDAAKLNRWVELIEHRARRLERMSIEYVHISVPEKLTLFDNKLHDPPIVDWRLSPTMRLAEMLQGSGYAHVWLDLIAPFRAARDDKHLYYKTDTHWTPEGCFLAYELVCDKLGIRPEPALLARQSREVESVLDLGMKMNPAVPEHLKLYDFTQNSRRTYANLIAQYLDTVTQNAVVHIGSHVRYENRAPSAAHKKILLFGDSYASQRPDGLTAMLAETAREVEFIWSSNLDWAYIKRARPDIVIYELVERFMTIVPNDQLSLRWTVARQAVKAKWRELKAGRRLALPSAKIQ
jgi:alginate O-acetyltransferase complex protein AlgJ